MIRAARFAGVPADHCENKGIVNAYVNGEDLVLVRRAHDGRRELKTTRAEYASFVPASVDAELVRALRSNYRVVSVREDALPGYLRVAWRSGEDRRDVHRSDYFKDHGVATYEADVDPVRRYVVDNPIAIQAPRRCFLDIETDSRCTPAEAARGEARILSAGVLDASLDGMVDVIDADTDAEEARLLASVFEAIDPYDQVCAWYGDGFDFPVIFARAERLVRAGKLRPVDLRRWLWCDQLEVYKEMNKATTSGDERESLGLNAVCERVLGEGKSEFDARATYEEWAAGGERRARMVAYMQQDVALLAKLEAKTGFLELFDRVCEACNVFPETHSLNNTAQVDGLLLRKLRERGMRGPSKEYVDDDRKIPGGLVVEPRWGGVARDVHVCDFSSMYPSIIRSFNMSLETLANVAVNGPIPDGHSRTPANRVGFRMGTEGVLPSALGELAKVRKTANDAKARSAPGTEEWHRHDRVSTAAKIVANAFYGVLGARTSRWYSHAIASAVTTTGRWLLSHVVAEAESAGFRVGYGDTDSVFVSGVTRGAFEAFVKRLNADDFPRILGACGARVDPCEVKLAYEKEFAVLVQLEKKKYAGRYTHYKWKTTCPDCYASADPEVRKHGAVDVRSLTCEGCGRTFVELPRHVGEPEMKGLEFVRGDSARLARALQKRVVERALDDAPADAADPEAAYARMLEEARSYVGHAPLSVEEVRLSKSLSKNLRDYVVKQKKDGTAAASPPHVEVARVLAKRGERVVEGTRVEYVVADASASPQRAIPASDYDGTNVDRFYLWNDLVFEPTLRVLEAAYPGVQWSKYQAKRPSKREVAARSTGQPGLFGAVEATDASPFGPPPTARDSNRAVVRSEADLRAAHAAWDGRSPLAIDVHLPGGAVVALHAAAR